MTTNTNVARAIVLPAADVPSQASTFAALGFALFAGIGLLVLSGMAQASVLHDAAHDQRHAMAFPCH